jgi:hypothetical protein
MSSTQRCSIARDDLSGSIGKVDEGKEVGGLRWGLPANADPAAAGIEQGNLIVATAGQDIADIEKAKQGLGPGSSLAPKLLRGTEEPDGPDNRATPMA